MLLPPNTNAPPVAVIVTGLPLLQEAAVPGTVFGQLTGDGLTVSVPLTAVPYTATPWPLPLAAIVALG